MGELAPVAVPRTFLRIVLKQPEQGGMRDPLARALSELVRLSLVELDTNGNPIAHRLILAFVRHRNTTDDASPFDACREAIQTQMSRSVEDPDADTLRELQLLAPYAEYLLGGGRLPPEEAADLLSRMGTHHQTSGRFVSARDALTAALRISEKAFEPGHPSIARRQSNLALVLKELGRSEEARDLLGKAYAASLKRLGPDHPSTRTFKRNLKVLG